MEYKGKRHSSRCAYFKLVLDSEHSDRLLIWLLERDTEQKCKCLQKSKPTTTAQSTRQYTNTEWIISNTPNTRLC